MADVELENLKRDLGTLLICYVQVLIDSLSLVLYSSCYADFIKQHKNEIDEEVELY